MLSVSQSMKLPLEIQYHRVVPLKDSMSRNTTKQVSAGGSVIAGKLEKETAQGGGISE